MKKVCRLQIDAAWSASFKVCLLDLKSAQLEHREENLHMHRLKQITALLIDLKRNNDILRTRLI